MRAIHILRHGPDRVLAWVALLLVGWPMAHAVLVQTLDVSSWRFGGWGMYATAAPRASQVVAFVRRCDAPTLRPALASRGPRVGVLDDGGLQLGGLAVDATGYRLASDLAAFRGDHHFVAFAGWLRRAHHVPTRTPLALAVVEPRVHVSGRRAMGIVRLAIVRDGELILRDRFSSSVVHVDVVLPPCGSTS